MSGDHRLDRSEAEAQRIRDAGGNVHREMPEGGPKGGILRTGALAIARSLGDASNPHVLALPDVQRVRPPCWRLPQIHIICHKPKKLSAVLTRQRLLGFSWYTLLTCVCLGGCGDAL